MDPNGWISTGDLGRMGSDGNLQLVGRSVEMLIRGGYNVYPSEVEAVLGSHPAVGQVTVVGAPDPVLGEVVVAFVVPCARLPKAPRGSRLSRSCEPTAEPRWRITSRRTGSSSSSELPTTPLGKIDTRALVALAAAATGTPTEVARHEPKGASA